MIIRDPRSVLPMTGQHCSPVIGPLYRSGRSLRRLIAARTNRNYRPFNSLRLC